MSVTLGPLSLADRDRVAHLTVHPDQRRFAGRDRPHGQVVGHIASDDQWRIRGRKHHASWYR